MRLDHIIIYNIIEPDSKVLDLGCGDGELLSSLVKGKNIKAQGIELSEKAIYECVEKGLSVFHSDIDSGLVGYPDKSFNYVILNQSLQQVKKIDFVVEEALRVGRKVIVGFPNFAYIRARLRLFFRGKVPITSSLPYSWSETPNIRFLSLIDFLDYCIEKRIIILNKYYLGDKKTVHLFPNLFALNGVFVLTKSNKNLTTV